MKRWKAWIGNLDGSRAGLVVTTSKERARRIIGTSRRDFENYWVLQVGVDETLEFERLYTRPIQNRGEALEWQLGRCPLGET
jgi:hypothetical protein